MPATAPTAWVSHSPASLVCPYGLTGTPNLLVDRDHNRVPVHRRARREQEGRHARGSATFEQQAQSLDVLAVVRQRLVQGLFDALLGGQMRDAAHRVHTEGAIQRMRVQKRPTFDGNVLG
jgi:hypothetical protein